MFTTTITILNWLYQNHLTYSPTKVRWKCHKICPKTIEDIWNNRCITFSCTHCKYTWRSYQ